MLHINCPFCGLRAQKEFAYGGDATVKRPEINKEVQSEGWSFNTEIDVVLTRDSSNNINLAANVISADPNIHHHPDNAYHVEY